MFSCCWFYVGRDACLVDRWNTYIIMDNNNENINELIMMFVIFIFRPFFKGLPQKISKISNFFILINLLVL